MFANFFITFEKAKKKVGSAPPRTALQKTYKKYFEKRCRKVSTSSLRLAGVLVLVVGIVVTFPCATIGQLSSLVVVEELFFMKLL